MAENTAFNKVTVDNGTRDRSKFNLSHPVSCTLPFGWVAPTMVQKMVPNSSHSVGTKQLCRLEPMVLPVSQGSIEIETLHQFVGMSDLFRNYGAFLTGQPFSNAQGVSYFPTLPSIRHCDLSMYVLIGAKIQIYAATGNYDEGDVWVSPVNDTLRTQIVDGIKAAEGVNSLSFNTSSNGSFNAIYPDYCTLGNTINRRVRVCVLNPLWRGTNSIDTNIFIPVANVGNDNDKCFFKSSVLDVNIGKCDYVIERNDITLNNEDTPTPIAFAINLSDFGKRLQFILDAAGYGVSFTSTKPVDLTRLFAIYMAYYGAFGLSKYQNYESTFCSQFLRGYENGANGFRRITIDYGTTTNGSASYLNYHFVRFLQDLVWMFSTDKVDYISSHRASDVTTESEYGWIGNVVIAPSGPSLAQAANTDLEPSSPRGSTYAPYINLVNHTQVDADLLKLLYKVTNRNTVAGRRIEELLRAGGYGAYVDQQKSHFIGRTSFQIDIADVNATSDSTSAAGRTSTLGSYAGKGVGGSTAADKFTYDTDEAGYWITLTVVVPDSSYCQQTDMTVYDCSSKQQYQSEFDSLGYEFNTKHVVMNGQDWTITGEKNGVYEPCKLDDSFGLVPRFMRYKVAQGKLLGQFRRRSTRDAVLPFVLSKWIDVNNKYPTKYVTDTDGNLMVSLQSTAITEDLPIGGQAWRFLNKFPWLANFERIFAYTGAALMGYASPNLMSRYLYCNYTQDYFDLFMYFFYDMQAPMLPISDSYSTTDDNDGKGKSMTVA